MSEAYIVDAVGRRKGGLADVHPADLGAHPIRRVVERTGIDPAASITLLQSAVRTATFA